MPVGKYDDGLTLESAFLSAFSSFTLINFIDKISKICKTL